MHYLLAIPILEISLWWRMGHIVHLDGKWHRNRRVVLYILSDDIVSSYKSEMISRYLARIVKTLQMLCCRCAPKEWCRKQPKPSVRRAELQEMDCCSSRTCHGRKREPPSKLTNNCEVFQMRSKNCMKATQMHGNLSDVGRSTNTVLP